MRRHSLLLVCLALTWSALAQAQSGGAGVGGAPSENGAGGMPTSTACTPGGQFACPCSDGAMGVQVCAKDGNSVGPCEHCSATFSCAPGATISCLCVTGGLGVQDCSENGDSLSGCRDCLTDNPGCIPGAVFGCSCAGEGTGVQTCLEGGMELSTCSACSTGEGGAGGVPAAAGEAGKAGEADIGGAGGELVSTGPDSAYYSSCVVAPQTSSPAGMGLLVLVALGALARRRGAS